MKKRFLALVLVMVISIGFMSLAGCDKDSKTIAAINSTTVQSDGTDVINKVKKLFDDNGTANNIMEDGSDTLYVGLPSDLGIDDNVITQYQSYENEKKQALRDAIGWDDFIKTSLQLNDKIQGIVKDSKYKHVLLHMYNLKGNTTTTYLLFKDGVIQKDVLAIS